jgi:hypothetical protein
VGSGDGAVEGTAADQKGGGGGVKKFDFEDYRIEPDDLKTLKPGPGSVARAKSKTVSGIRRRDAFAIVPLWWARCANTAGNVNNLVCAELLYRAWRVRDGSKTFAMPNCRGVSSKTKIRTLRVLEQAGLIAVNWRDKRSPMVTLTVSPF